MYSTLDKFRCCWSMTQSIYILRGPCLRLISWKFPIRGTMGRPTGLVAGDQQSMDTYYLSLSLSRCIYMYFCLVLLLFFRSPPFSVQVSALYISQRCPKKIKINKSAKKEEEETRRVREKIFLRYSYYCYISRKKINCFFLRRKKKKEDNKYII